MMRACVAHAAGSHRQEQEQEPVSDGRAQQREALCPPRRREHRGGIHYSILNLFRAVTAGNCCYLHTTHTETPVSRVSCHGNPASLRLVPTRAVACRA